MLRKSATAVGIFLAICFVDFSKAEEGDEVGPFSRSVLFETQLVELESCGIRRNAGVTNEDIQTFEDQAAMEASPYKGIVDALAFDIEREPFSPVSNTLWMCDYERIEGHGAYRDILVRLELMTDSALGLTDITDFVDWEEEKAWVQFNYNGATIRWDAEFDNDWMDPYVIVKYDQLLKEIGSDVRIYSNHSDYGQAALFAGFSATQYDCFKKLSKVRLRLIETQT